MSGLHAFIGRVLVKVLTRAAVVDAVQPSERVAQEPLAQIAVQLRPDVKAPSVDFGVRPSAPDAALAIG
jgi:hypothetical protein